MMVDWEKVCWRRLIVCVRDSRSIGCVRLLVFIPDRVIMLGSWMEIHPNGVEQQQRGG